MGNAGIAAVLRLRRELGSANIIFKAKCQVQADGVFWAADEAVAGAGGLFGHNGLHGSLKRKAYHRSGRQAQQTMKKRPVQIFPKRRLVHLGGDFVLNFLVQAG